MRKIKIAMAQVNPIHGDLEKNLEKALNIIKEASEARANLVIFSELFYSGNFNKRKVFHELAEYSDGKLYEEIKKVAIKYNIAVIIGYPEKKKNIEGEVFNSIMFVDSCGNLVGSYNKYYCWGPENKTFTKGTELPVFKTNIGNIALLNCYDAEFPELFRIFALKKAELVVCCALWTKEIQDRWHTSLVAGAMNNLYFVAGVNIVGENPKGVEMCGDTKLINPLGKVIINASINREEVIYKTIDLDEVKEVRENYPIWKDFRKEMYKDKAFDFLK